MSTKPLPVVISPMAEGDLLDAYEWAAKKAPLITVVEQWYARFLEYLQSLGASPEMYPPARESRRAKMPLRETLFGRPGTSRFRVIFRVDNDRVVILCVRRGSRGALSRKDIERLREE